MISSIAVRHHRTILFAALGLIYLVVLYGVAGLRDHGAPGHALVRIAAAGFELACVSLLCAGLLRAARVRWRWVLVPVMVVFAASAALAYLIQCFSLYVSGNFLTVLAIQNADSVSFIGSPVLLVSGGVVFVWIALFALSSTVASVGVDRTRLGIGERCSNAVYAVLLVVVLLPFIYLLMVQEKGQSLEPDFRQAPLASLLASTYRAKVGGAGVAELADTLIDGPGCYRYPADPGIAAYPFQRRHVYDQPLPYRARWMLGTGRPNVIVIFSEGVSARLIGAYGGSDQYPDLTPNIDRLAGQSMRVDNYFNHTAATFRGLGGQLTSGYAATDGGGPNGWENTKDSNNLTGIRRSSLPMILGQRGYDSYFFSPHRRARALNTMLRSLGFNEVFDFESIGGGLLKGDFSGRSGTGALEDQSLFKGLQAFLQARDVAGEKKPFFVGTYNIGTHAFIEPGPGNAFYGESDNRALNKLHNYDAALGEFLRWFDASPYAGNTILILTADHATYPEKPYRQVAGKDLKPYFVDRIPLLVRDPFHVLPESFDAEGRSSLGLAPTVLHLLGVRRAANSFLGRSLFEAKPTPTGIASVDSAYYMTTSSGVYARDEVPPAMKADFECQVGVVQRYYKAEQENRIFAPETGNGAR